MRKLFFLLLPLALLAAGCAHNLSDKSRALADPGVTFSMLRENPDAYRGKFVLLGGTIADASLTAEGIQLEIVQHDLDSREAPDETSTSGGRFLAITDKSLDLAKCRKERLVSLAGEVAGKKVGQFQGAEYTYPVITVKELHLFKTGEEDSFHTWVPYTR
jgi:outer membrane lipoprotein